MMSLFLFFLLTKLPWIGGSCLIGGVIYFIYKFFHLRKIRCLATRKTYYPAFILFLAALICISLGLFFNTLVVKTGFNDVVYMAPGSEAWKQNTENYQKEMQKKISKLSIGSPEYTLYKELLYCEKDYRDLELKKYNVPKSASNYQILNKEFDLLLNKKISLINKIQNLKNQ